MDFQSGLQQQSSWLPNNSWSIIKNILQVLRASLKITRKYLFQPAIIIAKLFWSRPVRRWAENGRPTHKGSSQSQKYLYSPHISKAWPSSASAAFMQHHHAQYQSRHSGGGEWEPAVMFSGYDSGYVHSNFQGTELLPEILFDCSSGNRNL